jgi:D-2-hydroxyacid dehydrogenase (NADP+)
VESINLLVTTALNEASLKQIKRISTKIKLTDISGLAQFEKKGDAAAKKQLDALLGEAEIIYGFRLPENLIARAPKLRWFQTMSAGVDRFLTAEFRRSSVVLTSVSGIHATPISEFVLSLMLMFAKKAPLAFQQKQQKQWQPFLAATLRSKTVGVVGLGHIGREVARLARAFGMRVVATRRSARKAQRARYVDRLYPPGQLKQLLSESDYVVLTLPLTSETYRIIGEAELHSMKQTAYLINVARGGLVDEAALVRAIEDKRIAGAGLDVFATEPLPADSPMWSFPNVIISPHIAGGMEDYVARATAVFCENLRRYLSGRRLINIVDKKKGY